VPALREGPAPALRVALLLDGLALPAWRAETIRRMAQVDGVGFAVVVLPGPPGPPRSGGRDLGGLAWRAYLRTLTTVRRARGSAVMRPDSLAAELGDVPRLTARTEPAGRFRERFADETIAALREYRPDILLRFAFGILTGEVLTVATYGTWSFHFGDEERYRGGPPAFWEVYEGCTRAGGMLQRLGERLDAGVILRKGLVPTVLTSYPQTWDAVHEQALDWPAQVCRDILARRDSGVAGLPSPTSAPVRRRPGNAQMAVFAARLLGRRLRAGRRS
jgi:hypothetical protein